MKILLVGEAAREHIIAACLARDSEVYAIMRKPNPGIAKIAKKFWVCNNLDPVEVEKTLQSAGVRFDLGFASPDAVLAAGISDVLARHGIPTASPTRAAARIEWDKGFMRSLLQKHAVAGAVRHRLVRSESEAFDAMHEFGPVALKPLGLTGGKGVRVSGDHFVAIEDGMAYVRELLAKDGVALVEEKLDGEEFSLQAFSDGTRIAVMPPVQDHKRALDADKGPNTGGMGSYSSGALLPFMSQSDLGQATAILQQTIDALRAGGTPFQGVLYGQFMAVREGVRVIEFNARFGDPEAMNVLSLLETPLSSVFQSIAKGKLCPVSFRSDCTVVKYLVPEGYPDKPASDTSIEVNESALERSGVRAYYAAVHWKGDQIRTTSSRAVGIVGIAPTLTAAEAKAEAGCQLVKGSLRHRQDIGSAGLVQKRIGHMQQIRG